MSAEPSPGHRPRRRPTVVTGVAWTVFACAVANLIVIPVEVGWVAAPGLESVIWIEAERAANAGIAIELSVFLAIYPLLLGVAAVGLLRGSASARLLYLWTWPLALLVYWFVVGFTPGHVVGFAVYTTLLILLTRPAASDWFGRPLSGELLNKIGPILALQLVFIFFALIGPRGYSTPDNLEQTARQAAMVASAAIGMTVVIIAAGIDLSVGSLIALCLVVVAWFVREGWSPIGAALLGILVGGVAGSVNGLLVTRLRLAPFIVTLGTMLIFRGIALDVADNRSVVPGVGELGVIQAMLRSLEPAQAWMLVPWGVWLVLALALATGGMLTYTRFGRHVFAVGSNEDTARLCGVAVSRVKVLVFTLGGLFAGLGGLVLLSRLQTGDPTAAFGAELDVIAAVVIGGGSLAGGQGSIVGSLAGAMLMVVIASGCQQMDIADYWQKIITGAIIIIAIALDHLRHRKA